MHGRSAANLSRCLQQDPEAHNAAWDRFFLLFNKQCPKASVHGRCRLVKVKGGQSV